MLRAILIASALVLAAVSPGQAVLLFDDASRADFTSNRAEGFSPLAAITVSAPTAINQIGALVDLSTAGNLKFVIFDLNSHALLFSTGSTAYADDGLVYKVSPVFSDFVLTPGITYGIGAIADVAGLWSINNTSANNDFTQNNITADDDRNGNVSSFAAPTLSPDGTAMIMIQLYGTVPEPATLSVLATGLAMLAVAGRRLRGHRS